MNGTYIGVIDRIVDGKTAVVLLEDDGEVIEQLDVPVSDLPADGRTAGSVLAVEVADGEFVAAEYLPRETEQRQEAIEEKLDRLSRRLSDE